MKTSNLIIVLFLIGILFQSNAQDKTNGENYDSSTHSFRLDTGLTAGNKLAGQGQFICVIAKLLGPLTLYAEVEHYQFEDLTLHSSRFGAQALISRSN